MAVEVVESDIAATMELGDDANSSMDNGKINIKFGSHDVDDPVKGEESKVSVPDVPKDAVDEWPEPKQIHSFYLVRYRVVEDQNVKAKLDLADKDLQKKNQARQQIIEKLKTKRADRSQLIAQLKSLGVENKQFRTIMDGKRKEMEPLQQALGKLRGASGGRERGSVICSSEQELNDVIKSFQYRIQHESIPLSEEKQILREIKQLEGTREKVVAYAAERARIQDSLGEKESIQGQVKSIGVDLDGVRKEKQVINAKLKQLDDEKLALEKEISILEDELTAVSEKRDNIYDNIKDLRKQREEGNSPYYQNRTLLTKAKVLAANKDVDALKELQDTEVDKFITLWNSNKAFRDDYEKRILSSLDMRQLSKDGRLRNPGEKPLVQSEIPTPSQIEPVKTSSKQTPREVLVSSPPVDAASTEQKAQKTKSAKNNKEANMKTETPLEKVDQADEDEVFAIGKSSLPKREEVDEKKLKELKREEEIAKRIQAEERKKKLSEKAAAKAAIKAQKEAEKKLKEREKRARKKSGAAAVADADSEETEPIPEVDEQEEKVEEKLEAPVPHKRKNKKENTIRHRGRPRGSDAFPKAVLKRKKATNYWLYAAPAAALVAILLVVVGYSYLR